MSAESTSPPRVDAPRTSLTAGEIADLVGGVLHGQADVPITGINTIENASPGEITFATGASYLRALADCRASAVMVQRGKRDAVAGAIDAIIEVDDVEAASITLLERLQPPPSLPDAGIHPTAFVHPEAELAADVRVGPHASVDRGALLERGVVIHAGARIYADVRIGEESIIHAGCVVRERCRLGRRVILHQNVSIGADGFGYRPAPDGKGLRKVPHLGWVEIGDAVEIGAGTCVDRGKFGPTVIGAETKIDNLVQIAHNCVLGPACVIAGQAGLAGSVHLGAGVQIGAQAGVTEHVVVGDGARIGAQSGVMRDVKPGESVVGSPAQPARETLRQVACLRKLPDLMPHVSRSGRVAPD